MSSPPLRRTFGSSVFLRALSIGLTGLVLLIVFVWSLESITRSRVKSAVKAAIAEQAEEITQIFDQEGLGEVIDSARREGRAIWPEDWLFDAVEEGDFLFRLIGPDGETLAGYDDLDPPGDYFEFNPFAEEGDHFRVITLRYGLDEEIDLVVGRSLPPELVDFQAMAFFATLILILTIVPVAGAIGFVLGRQINSRLSEMTQTVSAIGEGSIDQRASLSGRDDEFDRFAGDINTMLDRISTLTRNVRAVSVGVAHDLKTPVSNIGGRLQLIERDIEDPDAIRTHLEKTETHIATLLRTLDAILRLGEVEAGRRRAAFQTLELSALTQDLAESFEPVLADADKHLSIKVTPHLWVEGDPDLLTQMLTNLLENVAEHARDGASAWITLRRHETSALVIVGDDGPGIPETFREQIFDRFFRVETSRSAPGNGLGLSLVRAIAELHGGAVSLRPGEPGAVFEVEIPLTGGLAQP